MANGSDERVTPSSVVGDTMLRIGEGNLAEQTEFQNSALGKALFYIPSMIMGARVGGQIAETIPAIQEGLQEGFSGLKELFSQRKAKRSEWNALPDDEKRSYGNFRRYVRQTLRQPTQRALRKFQAGDDIVIDGQNLGERKMTNFQDRIKLRAFYLNGMKDYSIDDEGKTVQNTPTVNVGNMFTSQGFNTYQNPTGLINQYNQPTPVMSGGFMGRGMVSPNVINQQSNVTPGPVVGQQPPVVSTRAMTQPNTNDDFVNRNIFMQGMGYFNNMYDFYMNNRQAINTGTRNYMGARFGYGFGNK